MTTSVEQSRDVKWMLRHGLHLTSKSTEAGGKKFDTRLGIEFIENGGIVIVDQDNVDHPALGVVVHDKVPATTSLSAVLASFNGRLPYLFVERDPDDAPQEMNWSQVMGISPLCTAAWIRRVAPTSPKTLPLSSSLYPTPAPNARPTPSPRARPTPLPNHSQAKTKGTAATSPRAVSRSPARKAKAPWWSFLMFWHRRG